MSKILVAEDDKFLASAYRLKLGKTGHQVKIVSDGEEALEALNTFIPDIMVLDIVMPKVDGFTLLKEIRTNTNLKNVPVIVASNLGQSEDMIKATQLGATDYIVKTDLSMNDLVDKINSLVLKNTPHQAGNN
jgi:DNA-binding response OmpR family regulator